MCEKINVFFCPFRNNELRKEEEETKTQATTKKKRRRKEHINLFQRRERSERRKKEKRSHRIPAQQTNQPNPTNETKFMADERKNKSTNIHTTQLKRINNGQIQCSRAKAISKQP